MSHTVSGDTTSYTWDAAAGLPVILQDSQGNTYVYGLDLISRTDSGGVQEYYLYDGLGSTTDLTDGSGNNVASYGYDVFGAIRSQSGSSANLWLFTGEQRDSNSKLVGCERGRQERPWRDTFPNECSEPARLLSR